MSNEPTTGYRIRGRLPIDSAARERGFLEEHVAPGAPASLLRGLNSSPATVIAVSRSLRDSGIVTAITVREERPGKRHLSVIDPDAGTITFTLRPDGTFYPAGMEPGCRIGLSLGRRETISVEQILKGG